VTQPVNELKRFGLEMSAELEDSPLPFTSVAAVADNLRKMRTDATDAHNALAKLAKQDTVSGLLHDEQAGD
jgi:hypothetical protein